jgi:hypothetical protein
MNKHAHKQQAKLQALSFLPLAAHNSSMGNTEYHVNVTHLGGEATTVAMDTTGMEHKENKGYVNAILF